MIVTELPKGRATSFVIHIRYSQNCEQSKNPILQETYYGHRSRSYRSKCTDTNTSSPTHSSYDPEFPTIHYEHHLENRCVSSNVKYYIKALTICPYILIVGAGPAGLAAAWWLARCGIDARVVDKKGSKVYKGQADGLRSRTTEILDSMG
jgi:hypothetical protein